MRIQHNIAALNSHRQLTGNNSSVAKNLEKLSSGYRINRAGDDAAGLAISEKMRAQITGLNTASKNAQDGISLVQTAEGALTEVHSMLNRMAELANQSSNGTYKDEVDRANIQKEYVSLKDEIDRISTGTNFNGIKLLDGTLGGGGGGGGTAAVAPDVSATIAGGKIDAADVDAVADVFTAGALKYGTASDSVVTIAYTNAAGEEKTKDITVTGDTDAATSATALKDAIGLDDDLKELFTVGGDENGITMTSKTPGANLKVTGITVKNGDIEVEAGSNTTNGAEATKAYDLSGALTDGDKVTIGEEEYTYADTADGSDGKTFGDLTALKAAVEKNGTYEINIDETDAVTVSAKEAAGGGGAAGAGLVLQIGESADPHNKLTVSVASMSTVTLGIGDLDLGTQDGAAEAMKKISDAINTVSTTRGDLGAIQNRLEHTINNLGVTAENMTAAESRIRDVDMAQEMMAFTKNNILTQASQSMLAQANQLPQGVLQLLQ